MGKDKEEKPIVYEVLFAGRKDKDDVILGPFMIKSSNRMVAIARAGIENAEKFKGVSLLSLEVKVRGF